MLNQTPSIQDIEKHAHEAILAILEEKNEGAVLPVITRDQRLGADLGLSSLDLAQLVTALELRLEADPFQELVAITSVRTVADLVSAYERFFAGESTDVAADEALLASKRRAEARRAGGR